MITEISYKTLSLIPTISRFYEQLENEIDDIIKNSGQKPKLTFSITDTIEREDGKDFDPDEWAVIAPDIYSDQPVFEGKCRFFVKSWWNNKQRSKIYNNPTWKDIILEANRFAGLDHRFLESVEIDNTIKDSKGIKFIQMWFGS